MANKNPRGRKKAEQSSSTLVTALKFVALALTDTKAAPQFTHVTLRRNLASIYNPVFAVGHPIPDDIDAMPKLDDFLNALSKCGQSVSMTHLDSGRLSVKSDKFRAFVPCFELPMPHITPDAPCAAIDDRLRAAFEVVAGIPAHITGREWASAVLLQSGSVVACDGFSLAEYWHGIDLPPNLLIPKVSVDALLKAKKPLQKFGFSETSVTFYFEDGSWLKTQLLQAQYPDYNRILGKESNPWPLPECFWDAVKAVASFNEQGIVYFNNHTMSSHPTGEVGAHYDIVGLPDNKAYNGKFLLQFEGKADKFDFSSGDNCFFFGPNLRGAIAGIRR